MGIKVRHDQNVTSTIASSALGGKGKRQAEDSKALMQKAANENIAANRQLTGAHAPSASPGHASAPLTHASLISPGSPHMTMGERERMQTISESSDIRKIREHAASSERSYSAKQQADWYALGQAYEDAVRSGRYTQPELDELARQIDMQKMRIRENPIDRLQKEKTAQEDIDSRLVTLNGVQYYRNSKGDLELPPAQKPDDGGFGDFMKMYPKLSEYTEDVEQVDPLTKKTVIVPMSRQRTPQEVANIYREMQRAWKESGATAPALATVDDPVSSAKSSWTQNSILPAPVQSALDEYYAGLASTYGQEPQPVMPGTEAPVPAPVPRPEQPEHPAPVAQTEAQKKWAHRLRK